MLNSFIFEIVKISKLIAITHPLSQTVWSHQQASNRTWLVAFNTFSCNMCRTMKIPQRLNRIDGKQVLIKAMYEEQNENKVKTNTKVFDKGTQLLFCNPTLSLWSNSQSEDIFFYIL